MTTVTDVSVSDERPQQACLARCRVAMSEQQTEVMPGGVVAVSCSAAPGKGGLGRHLQEILTALERGGQQSFCISGAREAPAQPAGQGARWPAVELSRMAAGVSRLPLSQ